MAAAPALADSHDTRKHEFPLTMTEFVEAYPEVTVDQFGQIDADADGEVSEEEYKEAQEAGIIGGDED